MIEIICSGIGGQGVLVAGMILADIAMEDGKNVSWYPSYGFEMRGGAANCEVKIGDGDLMSPYCLEPDILLTMSESAIDTFEDRLKPGGVLLVNSSLVSKDRTYRDDIKVIKVPATEIAGELDNHRGTNIIMLGALAGASDLYDVDHVRAGMEHYFGKKGKNNPKNAAAFNAGAEATRAQK
ncbi:MAG: 2-oxoacid:acceptor oxidoreductase family protein [Bacillota bacterium]